MRSIPDSKEDVPFADPVAAALWSARAAAQGIDALERLPLTRANEIADVLYARLRERGARQIGWKIAATDPVAQRRFQTDGPFAAPLFDVSVLPDDSRLSLASLVAPVLEAEIGVGLVGGLATILPCIEIADCRVRDWNVSLAEAVADFGLQGAMVLGESVGIAVAGGLEVKISCDGKVISRGIADLPAALSRARTLEDASVSIFAAGTAVVIATGSVLPPLPLAVGRWTVSFGALGSLSLDVVP